MARHEMASPGGSAWLHWTAGWVETIGVRLANGSLRRRVFEKRLPELRAHQLFVATHVIALTQRFTRLQRRKPIGRTSTALAIGTTWAILTAGLEFGLGRLQHKEWHELVHDYDVRKGRLWPLVLVWMVIGPEVVRRMRPARSPDDAAS